MLYLTASNEAYLLHLDRLDTLNANPISRKRNITDVPP